MRMIVTVRLQNDKLMNIIGNAKTKEELRAQAAKDSNRLLGDSTLYVQKNSPIINCEEWATEHNRTLQTGNKQYMISFMIDNVVQVLNIEAAGVKSAYNNIRLKYGIQDEQLTLVYEINQSVKKKSALALSNEVVRNVNKLNKVLELAIEKSAKTPDLKDYRHRLVILTSLIYSTVIGKYNDITPKKIINSLAFVLYFLYPTELYLDATDEFSKISSSNAVRFVVNEMGNEIDKYKDIYMVREEGVVDVTEL
jgi:hypothetical protein